MESLLVKAGPILHQGLDLIVAAAQGAAAFLLAAVLPAVLLSLALLVLGRWTNRRLVQSFGFWGVMPLAWLGTPVHELSHLVGCWLGLNRVEEVKLFKPEPKTGSLGYVKHSYSQDSFYQRVIGNTVIAIAPFFGGSLAIYLLTRWLYPNLVSVPERLVDFDYAAVNSWSEIQAAAALWGRQLTRFYEVLFIKANLGRWQFWLYLLAMLSVAAHLSPSKSDFQGFWGPVLVLLVALFALQIGFTAFDLSDWLPAADQVMAFSVRLNALLLLALLFLAAGAAVVGALTFIWNLATTRSGK